MNSHPRRLFVPEVIQTSSMDCGPAALKCLLEGFNVPVSYGRLREACQTDVDGTSIDTLEKIAQELGLDAGQVMMPKDHLLLTEADALPAILVMWSPGGFTHFVVVWRRHGSWVQVMDPAMGRRWLRTSRLERETYEHIQRIPAAAWREWAGSNEFQAMMGQRLKRIGADRLGLGLLDSCLTDPSWESLAALDASLRLVDALVRNRGVARGPDAADLLADLHPRALAGVTGSPDVAIPPNYWSVRPAPDDARAEDGGALLDLRGAVMIQIREPQPAPDEKPTENSHGSTPKAGSAELAAALHAPPTRPLRELLQVLRKDGLLTPFLLLGALAMAAIAVMAEALLFRGLLELGRDLTLFHQRAIELGALLVFLTAVLLIEVPVTGALFRMGRHLELRLRVDVFEKLPRIGDRYFRSRPASDMAERSHALHHLRRAPMLGARAIRATFELTFTLVGVIWLYPSAALPATLLAVLGLALPMFGHKVLAERDFKVHNQAGALARFYLDAMLGLAAAYTHRAERALRHEHEGLLKEWAIAGRGLVRAALTVEAIQSFITSGLAVIILFNYFASEAQASSGLLLLYWVLNLPVIAQQLAVIARQYPMVRNRMLRLLDLLTAGETSESSTRPGGRGVASAAALPASGSNGVSIEFDSVSVVSAGHLVLAGVDLRIAPGSHVAIIGRSGAGKSTLAGLLLGWHQAASGTVKVDGAPLDSERLARLLTETVWVDPDVHLFNRSLYDNLVYGTERDPRSQLGAVLEQSDLVSVLEGLPNGLSTSLGEGGGLLSGGEGQRARFARGLLRPDARLVVLDEPFRGLDRTGRHQFLERARAWWRHATLLCVTHDVAETANFDRVLVIKDGRIVEDGAPSALAAIHGSRYRALLDAELRALDTLWAATYWRRLEVADGRVSAREMAATPPASSTVSR